MPTIKSKMDALLDRLQQTLLVERESCYAHAAWLVDSENRILAATDATTTAVELAPVIDAATIMSRRTPDAEGVLIHAHDWAFVVAPLPGRYSAMTLVSRLATDRASRLPCTETIAPVAATARLLARQIGQWMPAAAQNKLAKRNPDPLDLGNALYACSSAITSMQIANEDGLVVHSRSDDHADESGNGLMASYLVDQLDRSSQVAHLGPILELTWVDGGQGHIVIRHGDPLVIIHLRVDRVTKLPAIRGIIDYLLPDRHDSRTAGWLRDRGCLDPSRTSWAQDVLAPNGERLVRSRYGKLFHRPDCSQVGAIAPVNRRWLPTRLDGINKGLRPCRSCGA